MVEAGRAATAAGGGGLFRGTAALLTREVPFYMFGEWVSGSGLRTPHCSARGALELQFLGCDPHPACSMAPLPDPRKYGCAGMVGYQQLKKVANGACLTLTASSLAAVQMCSMLWPYLAKPHTLHQYFVACASEDFQLVLQIWS